MRKSTHDFNLPEVLTLTKEQSCTLASLSKLLILYKSSCRRFGTELRFITTFIKLLNHYIMIKIYEVHVYLNIADMV